MGEQREIQFGAPRRRDGVPFRGLQNRRGLVGFRLVFQIGAEIEEACEAEPGLEDIGVCRVIREKSAQRLFLPVEMGEDCSCCFRLIFRSRAGTGIERGDARPIFTRIASEKRRCEEDEKYEGMAQHGGSVGNRFAADKQRAREDCGVFFSNALNNRCIVPSNPAQSNSTNIAMKLHQTLIITAAIALASNFTACAEPKEWVGKELPELGVNFLGTAPEFKGKATIVEFWATWCPPCRASIPHLNEINKKFKDKGLVVIGITDEKQDIVEKFQKTLPMEYSVAVGGAAIEKKFGINGIPHAFVVGKDGKIVWEGHPMQLTEDVIEKALK